MKVFGFQPVISAIRSEKERLPVSPVTPVTPVAPVTPVTPIAPIAPVTPMRKIAPFFFVPYNFFENFFQDFTFNYFILAIFHDICTP